MLGSKKTYDVEAAVFRGVFLIGAAVPAVFPDTLLFI
jgi:hypothetical protein